MVWVFQLRSLTMNKRKQYIVIPLVFCEDDFTLQRYISRGEFCGESGRTGLGGNHVYSIAKRHDGFINLTSIPEWPVIIEVLIPVEYDADVESNNVVVYANSKDCM